MIRVGHDRGVDWRLGPAGKACDQRSWYVFGGVDWRRWAGGSAHWMGGLGLGLVAIGGMALASSGLVFNSGSDKASFLDVADARTVSSGELFVSLSSGFLFVASLVGGSLVLASAAMTAIASGSSGLVFVVGGGDNHFLCQWR